MPGPLSDDTLNATGRVAGQEHYLANLTETGLPAAG